MLGKRLKDTVRSSADEDEAFHSPRKERRDPSGECRGIHPGVDGEPQSLSVADRPLNWGTLEYKKCDFTTHLVLQPQHQQPSTTMAVFGDKTERGEGSPVSMDERISSQPTVRLDRYGNALTPQPSPYPEDPLNWSLTLKIAILVQASLLAALGTLNTAIINPAYSGLSKEFGITTVTAGYQTTVVIALNGLGPFLWVPLANKFGRRPVYLFTTLLGFASALGCAYTKNFGQLIAARVFNGLFPCALALGAVTVTDLFFLTERGRAMGLFTVMLTNGSHLAPIIGGLLGQYLGWRWTFKFAAIADAFMFLLILVCMPETLYVRSEHALMANNPNSTARGRYLRSLRLYSNHPHLHLKPKHFILPALKMARYPSVLFPALYYAAQYGFASILPAVTVATIFSARFGFDTLQIGLGYGLALIIGASLGELASGMVVDAIVKRERRRLNGIDPPPEARLKAIWTGALLVPSGLLIYGFCIQYSGAHWMGALMGMGIACFGLQVLTTVCYTYAIDCYKPEASEVSLLFNFIRQAFGCTFAFYAVKLGQKIGFQFEFIFFAGCGSLLGFIPVLALMWKGREWRERLGRPVGVDMFDEVDGNDERRFEGKGVGDGKVEV